jgi:hypothetical protein
VTHRQITASWIVARESAASYSAWSALKGGGNKAADSDKLRRLCEKIPKKLSRC